MTKTGTLGKTLILILCAIVALAFSVMITGGIQQANAAKKMKMPKKLTVYMMNDSDRYTKYSETTYKYNKKGDVTKTTKTYFDCGDVVGKTTISIKYTYKKGKKVKAVAKASNGYEKYTVKYDKKQRIKQLAYKGEDGTDTYKYKYKKSGYLKSAAVTTNNPEQLLKSTKVTYKTVLKKGKAKKITKSGRNFHGDKEKIITKYNKAGLRTYVDANGADDKYKYTIKKGLVTKADVSGLKYVYSYGKKKVSKAAYYNFINEDDRDLCSHFAYNY